MFIGWSDVFAFLSQTWVQLLLILFFVFLAVVWVNRK